MAVSKGTIPKPVLPMSAKGYSQRDQDQTRRDLETAFRQLTAPGAVWPEGFTVGRDPDPNLSGHMKVGGGIVSDGGHLYATDNTFDIGASGANRPRTVYAGTSVNAPTISGTTGSFSGGVSGASGSFSGAVSGTTGTFSSTLSGQSLTINGTQRITSAGAATFAGITGTSLGVGTGTVTCGTVSCTSVSSSGGVSGTTISGSSLNVGTGTVTCGTVTCSGGVSGTTISGTSLNVGTGTVTCGTVTCSGGVSGTTISGSSLNVGTGTVTCGTVTCSGGVSGTTGSFSSTLSGLSLTVNGTQRISSTGAITGISLSIVSGTGGTVSVTSDGTGQTHATFGASGSIDGQGGEFQIRGTSTVPITFYTNSVSRGIIYSDGSFVWSAQAVCSIYDNGTSGTMNWNNGNTQKVSANANKTFSFSNGIAGGVYTIHITQDATGSRTYTWPTVKWANGTAPTPSGANKIDIVTFLYDGTNWCGSYTLNH